MSFLLSANLFEDQWSFIILRDMLLLKRSTIKEFKSSREKIDDDTLSKTLRKLCISGYIKILYDGSSKSNCKRYIVSSKGFSLLPILMELYLFSCDRFEESLLSPFELNFKKEATQNCTLLKKKIIREYNNFTQKLKIEVAFS
jgi:DNA-binding HxlR family transcriptional regulator